MTKLFCDWCGREVPKGEDPVRRVKVCQVAPVAIADISDDDVCIGCVNEITKIKAAAGKQ